jgi:nicotinate-nucleotide pyrophosphorylase (carboxylating)
MTNKRNFPQLQWTPELNRLLVAALAEDVGPGDVTTERIVPVKLSGWGEIIAKANGIICGTGVAQKIWQLADKTIEIDWLAEDGEEVHPGQQVARMRGTLRGLLTGERVALNFLQQLSGVATITWRFHLAAGGAGGPVICDTRKTTPLWRKLERYAVAAGGGCNHRFGLFDMVLIKENHARAAGGLREAINRARGKDKIRIAAEARNAGEVKICCEERVDLILLDNFTAGRARTVIDRFRSYGIPFEISGGVNLRNIAAYAAAGPDRISIGALTHSAPALDLSVQLYQEDETAD